MRIIIAYSFLFILINALLLKENENAFLYESFTVIEFTLFSSFIYIQINKKKSKQILLITSIAFILFYIAYYFIGKSKLYIDSIPIGIETIIILGFSFYYLYEQMNDTTTLFIYNKPAFWIILGIVLYLAGSFFIYIFANYLSRKDVEKYWVITNIFSVIKSILFSIAIIIHAKPTKNTLTSDLELSSLN